MALTIGEVTYNAYKAEFFKACPDGTVENVRGDKMVIKEWGELTPLQQGSFASIGLAAAKFATMAGLLPSQVRAVGEWHEDSDTGTTP